MLSTPKTNHILGIFFSSSILISISFAPLCFVLSLTAISPTQLRFDRRRFEFEGLLVRARGCGGDFKTNPQLILD